MAEIIPAYSVAHYQAAAILFKEYSEWLQVDLCFQGFEEEMATLHTMYCKPIGALILLEENNGYIGCVGIRQKREKVAELKRMYVQPQHQRKGYGTVLLNKAIEVAIELGYEKIWLDTLAHMTPAVSLYKKYGFKEIDAYYNNPIEGAVYFEKLL